MTQLFMTLLTLSGQASLIVLAVLLLRLLLRRLPRRLLCLLWLLVAVRLLLPFQFSSSVSLQPQEDLVTTLLQQEDTVSAPQISPSDEVTAPDVSVDSPVTTGGVSQQNDFDLLQLLTGLWLAGMAAMLAYFALSYVRLRRRMAGAEAAEGYYRSEQVDSPFILGFLRPRIYLPAAMAAEDIPHVLAHERAHLRRRDHWTKPLAFLLLTLYWFNPLLWLAYVLLCRDIEGACDETVLRQAEPEQRAAYSRALVACAAPARRVAACPLAFGSSDVPGRVRRILSYRRPTFWLLLAAALGAVVVAVCLLSSPQKTSEPDAQPEGLSMSAGQLDRLRISYIGDAPAVVDLLQKLGFGQYGAFTVRLETKCPYAEIDYLEPPMGPTGVVLVYQTDDPAGMTPYATELHYLGLLALELMDNASWLQCVAEDAEGNTTSLAELLSFYSPVDREKLSDRAYLAALQKEINRRLALYRNHTLPWLPVETDVPQDYETYFSQPRVYDSNDCSTRGRSAVTGGSAGYRVSGGYHAGQNDYTVELWGRSYELYWEISRDTSLYPLAMDDNWVYFREGNRLTRRDYWGGQRTILWTDSTGDFSQTEDCVVILAEQTVLFFVAGYEDGYAVYRLFLPTGQVDILCTLAEGVDYSLHRAVSSQEVILECENSDRTYYLSCAQGQEPELVYLAEAYQ